MQIDHYGEIPVYRQLADLLRAGIADGTYPPGEFLPGTRTLADDHRLAVGTVRKALELLRVEGLIRNVPGRGSVVLHQQGRKRK